MLSDAAQPRLSAPAPIGGLIYVRDLTGADMLALATPGELPIASFSQTIKRLTASHHNIARLVADGRKASDIAAILGRSASSISNLLPDPGFKQLVAHYQAIKDTVYYSMHERLATVGLNAVEIINDRLEDHLQGDGTKVTLREAREVLEMVLDRTGVPAVSAVAHMNADMRGDSVAAQVREMFTKRTEGVVLEGDTQDQSSCRSVPPEDGGAPEILDSSDFNPIVGGDDGQTHE